MVTGLMITHSRFLKEQLSGQQMLKSWGIINGFRWPSKSENS